MIASYKQLFFFALSAFLATYKETYADTPAPSKVIYDNTVNNGIAVYPTISPVQTNEVNFQSIINLNVIIEQVHNIYTTVTTNITQTVQQWQQQWWHPHEYYQQSTNVLHAYRHYIIAATAAALYGTCYYKLYAGQRYLASTTSWSTWQNRYSTDTFCAFEPEKLAPNLIHDIQMEYATQANPTDFITPMVHFLTALHAELATCTQLLTWHTWISRLRLCRLFPCINCNPDALKDRIARLHRIKKIFLHWVATYNIEHNKKDLSIASMKNNLI